MAPTKSGVVSSSGKGEYIKQIEELMSKSTPISRVGKMTSAGIIGLGSKKKVVVKNALAPIKGLHSSEIDPEAEKERERVEHFFKRYNIQKRKEFEENVSPIEKELRERELRRKSALSEEFATEVHPTQKDEFSENKSKVSHIFKCIGRDKKSSILMRVSPIDDPKQTPGVGYYYPKYSCIETKTPYFAVWRPAKSEIGRDLGGSSKNSNDLENLSISTIHPTENSKNYSSSKIIPNTSSKAEEDNNLVQQDKQKGNKKDHVEKWLEKHKKRDESSRMSPVFMSKTKPREPPNSDTPPPIFYWPGADPLKLQKNSVFVSTPMEKQIGREEASKLTDSIMRTGNSSLKANNHIYHEAKYDAVKPRNQKGDLCFSNYVDRNTHAKSTRFGITLISSDKHPDRPELEPSAYHKFYDANNPMMRRSPEPVSFDKQLPREKQLVHPLIFDINSAIITNKLHHIDDDKDDSNQRTKLLKQHEQEALRGGFLPENFRSDVKRTPFYVYFDKQTKRISVFGDKKRVSSLLDEEGSPDYFDIDLNPIKPRSPTLVKMDKMTGRPKGITMESKTEFYNPNIEKLLPRSQSVDFSKSTSRERNLSPVMMRCGSSIAKESSKIICYDYSIKEKVKGDPFIRSQLGREELNKLRQKNINSSTVDKFYINPDEKLMKIKDRDIIPGYIEFGKQSSRDMGYSKEQQLLQQMIKKKRNASLLNSSNQTYDRKRSKSTTPKNEDVGKSKDFLLPRSPAFKFTSTSRQSFDDSII